VSLKGKISMMRVTFLPSKDVKNGQNSNTVSSRATVTIISCIPKNLLSLTLVTCVCNGPEFEQPQHTSAVDAQNIYLL
jgi:hypothetical protein